MQLNTVPLSGAEAHTLKVDVATNSSLRTIFGRLKLTPVYQLPALTGIAHVGIRRKAATLALARKAVKHDWHILHDTTKNEVPPSPPCRIKTILDRLRTGVGQYRSSTKKWGLADSAACECGEPKQTADHIINSCPLHRSPSEAGLYEIGPLTRAWL